MAEQRERKTATEGISLEATDDGGPTLIAYRLTSQPSMRLARSPGSRGWMNATPTRFATRCLPMLIANEAGWMVLNSHPIRVTWNGNNDLAGVKIEYLFGPPPYYVSSHFGVGILTWNIPYLFRTPPGYNLLVRGPANWPKDGISPLEGIVETDWAVATFTMNWKFTRPDVAVTFAMGEPICMLVPQRRGELEAFRPVIADIASNPALQQAHEAWIKSREEFILHQAKLRPEHPGEAPDTRLWQKHYHRGTAPDGTQAVEHQRKLTLRDFEDGASVTGQPLQGEPPAPGSDDL